MPVPAKLYKYRSVSSFTEDIIVNNRVYFSAPYTLNDPFDCKMPMDFSVSSEDFTKFIAEIGPKFSCSPEFLNALASATTSSSRKKVFAPLEAKYAKRLSHESSLFCVAEHGDDILMFAHYGDSHCGCCLEFDCCKDPFLKYVAKVTYQSDYPALNYFRLHGNDSEMSKRLFLTKASQWNYEKEWRVLRYKTPAGTYDFSPECLTGIIFGTEMSDADKKKVYGWVAKRAKPVKFFQAEVSRTSFALNINPI
jgi:hypothetical protein